MSVEARKGYIQAQFWLHSGLQGGKYVHVFNPSIHMYLPGRAECWLGPLTSMGLSSLLADFPLPSSTPPPPQIALKTSPWKH